MIEVQGLYKSFKNKRKKVDVLKDISFKAEPGKIFGLLGPNGAGKTTTLRTIATLLKPDKGNITVDGLNVQKKPRKVRDKIGFLTSDMKLSGNLSPRELLKFFGELNHLSANKIKERTEELAEYLDMKSYLDKPIVKLSTGMKQKASLAVSLIHDPEIIIFDEPTNGLDILASKVVVDFIYDSKKSGKTVVLSTHIMSEAEKLCDDIGIILEGELEEQGNMKEIMDKHNTDKLEDVFFNIASKKGVIESV
jgi:sodium transport system ATP-binding protein